jgi:acyl-CoA synthetase (AMP-forming)/AMP-acid ligase II
MGRSFLDLLRTTVAAKSESTFSTWYDVSGKATDEYTFGELWTEAESIAYSLRYEWGVLKGERVVLCYNFGCYEEDGGIPHQLVGFSWLPQYYDLGLIYASIAPFAGGGRMHYMSALTFIRNPLLWLELMSRGGYGLAENVVGVCWIHGFHLSEPRGEEVSCLVAVGSRDTFHHSLVVKTVNRESLLEVEDGETGELWIAGPSVAAGYFKKPELTREVFQAKINGTGDNTTFLRTGDLALFQEGKLSICGRIKDLIIVNGVNYYPRDIEAVVQDASKATRPGCVAAFASNDTCDDGSLEIAFEIRRSTTANTNEILASVLRDVAQHIGLRPSRVVAIKENAIPKTTSGKIRRGATQSDLHNGKLATLFDWNGGFPDDKIPPLPDTLDVASVSNKIEDFDDI